MGFRVSQYCTDKVELFLEVIREEIGQRKEMSFDMTNIFLVMVFIEKLFKKRTREIRSRWRATQTEIFTEMLVIWMFNWGTNNI